MSTSDLIRKFGLLLVLLPIAAGWISPGLFLGMFCAGVVVLAVWAMDVFVSPLFTHGSTPEPRKREKA